MSVFCMKCQCEVGYRVVEEIGKTIIKGYDVNYKKRAPSVKDARNPFLLSRFMMRIRNSQKRVIKS